MYQFRYVRLVSRWLSPDGLGSLGELGLRLARVVDCMWVAPFCVSEGKSTTKLTEQRNFLGDILPLTLKI